MEDHLTNLDLFYKQKETLDTFLRCGAITQSQYDYSLGCLRQKMNIQEKDTDKPSEK